VLGADCAYSADGQRIIAAAVLWDVALGRVVETASAVLPVQAPYIPGFLSFREAPAVIKAVRKIRTAWDCLLLDGHGLAHPRRCGIATFVGVLLDRPAAGIAKSVLVGRHDEPGAARGSHSPLVHRGEVVGAALRTRDGVSCVFVSVGHRMDLAGVVATALACGGGYRLPEPTRQADRLVAALRSGSGR